MDKRGGACVHTEQIQHLAERVHEQGLDYFVELMKWEHEEPRKVQAWLGADQAAWLLDSNFVNTASFKPYVLQQNERSVSSLQNEGFTGVIPTIPFSSDTDCLQVYV